jgi:putative inorganic carbon (hco3(-)) transporter
MIEQGKGNKIIYAAGLVIGVIPNIYSLSRGGFVGMACVAIVTWLFSSRKKLALILLCLVGLVVFFYAGDAYWDIIGTSGNTQEGTAVERLESWATAWMMFLDNPFGVGGNNFQVRFPECQSEYFVKGMWGRVARSLWFTLISEFGILGIIIYLLLKFNLKDIFVMKNLTIKGDQDFFYLKYLSYAFLGALASYFSSGSFISVLYYPHYWYLTALIAASIKIARTIMNSQELSSADMPVPKNQLAKQAFA